MHFSTSFKTLLLATTLKQVHGFWRMECRARTGLARIDPLVSPGEVAQHAHTIHGGNGFGETTTTDSLLASECTSCSVAQDKSAYWTPPLYFQDATTGQFELVEQVGGMLAYYLLYPNTVGDTTLYPFPAGFSMIAGDTNLRNFSDYAVPDIPKSSWTGEYTTQAFLQQAALGFNCLNYAIAPEGSLYRHFLPDKAYLDANCADGVRFELMFPSCWNGETNSPDQKSHVAYPSEVMTGNCPDTHPKRLVSLFYETIWNTAAYIGRNGQFVIANGDPTGYGYHGDFIMGWDEGLLTAAVDQCTNPSGLISDCGVFDIQDASVYGSCNFTMPEALVSENVVGPMAALPGNVVIAAGPGPADEATAGEGGSPAATSAIVPTLSHSPGVTPSTSATFVPGAVFVASTPSEDTSTTSSTSTTPTTTPTTLVAVPATTPATTPAPAPVDTQSYFSTEYSTSGLTVNEILWVEEIETITIPVTATMTTTPAVKKRHLHQHKRAHGI